MIEKRADCRTNPGTADTRRHIVFLRVLEQSGALFLCPDWLSCLSRSGPPERQPRRQSRHIVPVSSMPIMCARPCVCLQNRNDMAASGAAPVSGVRVMGWCGGEEGEGATEGGTAGSAAVRSGIDFVAFGEGVTVWCCGQDWCDSATVLRETGTLKNNHQRGDCALQCPRCAFYRKNPMRCNHRTIFGVYIHRGF